MRLLLTTRKRTVLDVEILPRPTKPAEDKGPTLRANGGGQVELADTFGDPQTTASFGFCAPPRS